MRVKTEKRRQAIMQAALSLFHEVGYERASMSEIAARLGGSKATLYGYFKTKDELYVSAMLDSVKYSSNDFLGKLDVSIEEIDVVLQNFGHSYVLFISNAEFTATKRSALAQGASSALGPMLYERGPKHAWDQVAAYLEKQMNNGTLRPSDPEIAALQLKGLLEAGIAEPVLFGAKAQLPLDRAVTLAVQAFMRIYGKRERSEMPPA
jgi:AcrR family transcriptional regulator